MPPLYACIMGKLNIVGSFLFQVQYYNGQGQYPHCCKGTGTMPPLFYRNGGECPLFYRNGGECPHCPRSSAYVFTSAPALFTSASVLLTSSPASSPLHFSPLHLHFSPLHLHFSPLQLLCTCTFHLFTSAPALFTRTFHLCTLSACYPWCSWNPLPLLYTMYHCTLIAGFLTKNVDSMVTITKMVTVLRQGIKTDGKVEQYLNIPPLHNLHNFFWHRYHLGWYKSCIKLTHFLTKVVEVFV